MKAIDKFDLAFNAGSSCKELFEIRNEVRRETDDFDKYMNDILRTINCYSSESKRAALITTPGQFHRKISE